MYITHVGVESLTRVVHDLAEAFLALLEHVKVNIDNINIGEVAVRVAFAGMVEDAEYMSPIPRQLRCSESPCRGNERPLTFASSIRSYFDATEETTSLTGWKRKRIRSN